MFFWQKQFVSLRSFCLNYQVQSNKKLRVREVRQLWDVIFFFTKSNNFPLASKTLSQKWRWLAMASHDMQCYFYLQFLIIKFFASIYWHLRLFISKLISLGNILTPCPKQSINQNRASLLVAFVLGLLIILKGNHPCNTVRKWTSTATEHARASKGLHLQAEQQYTLFRNQ